MVHSVELLFDPATEAALRRQWDALGAAGLPSAGRNPAATNRPHVTLAVAAHIDPAVDDLLRELPGLPLDCRVGAPMLFGSGSLTLVRVIVPSAELLDLQAGVDRLCLPYARPHPLGHTRPGEWTPHVTLCRRLAPADVGTALSVLDLGDLHGTFTGLRHWDGAGARAVTLRE